MLARCHLPQSCVPGKQIGRGQNGCNFRFSGIISLDNSSSLFLDHLYLARSTNRASKNRLTKIKPALIPFYGQIGGDYRIALKADAFAADFTGHSFITDSTAASNMHSSQFPFILSHIGLFISLLGGQSPSRGELSKINL